MSTIWISNNGDINALTPENYLLEENIKSTNIADFSPNSTFKPKNTKARTIYIGDGANHAPRLKVSERGKNFVTGHTISFYIDNNNIVKTEGYVDDFVKGEMEYYSKLCIENWNLLLYISNILKYANLDLANKVFVNDCLLRDSFTGEKAEGKLANPSVVRNPITGDRQFLAYVKTKYGNYFEIHKFSQPYGKEEDILATKDLGKIL